MVEHVRIDRLHRIKYDTIFGLERYSISFLLSEARIDDNPIVLSSFGPSDGRIQTCPNEHGTPYAQNTGGLQAEETDSKKIFVSLVQSNTFTKKGVFRFVRITLDLINSNIHAVCDVAARASDQVKTDDSR